MKLWSWMSIWIFLILLKDSVLNSNREKSEKTLYTYLFSLCKNWILLSLRRVTCQGEQKMMAGAWELSAGSALQCSCHPWALHQNTWGDEKCNSTRLKLLFIWTSRAALCLKPTYAHVNINIIYHLQCIKWGPCFDLPKQPCVIFDVPEQPTLSQWVKTHPLCLQWQVVLCARKACGSWALALQDTHLSTLGRGLPRGTVSISFHPLQWECLKLV